MLKKIIYLALTIVVLNLSNAFAEWETASGRHEFLDNFTKSESCEIALQKAIRAAAQKAVGKKLSYEEWNKCSEIDGELDCERHQTAVSLLDIDAGEIVLIKEKFDKEKKDDLDVFFCEVEIKADIKQITKGSDPNFDFTFKINNNNYRNGEKMEIEIIPSKKMFMSIFQYYPYVKNDYQIQKIFPWPCENNNQIGPETIRLPGRCQKNVILRVNNEEIELKKGSIIEYEVQFPENMDRRDRIDEYIIFVASKNNINWLMYYATYSDFRNALFKEKELIRKTRPYTIVRN